MLVFQLLKKVDRFHETKKLFLNIDKAKKELNWKPIFNLQQTIDLTVDWYKNFFLDRNMINFTEQQIEFFCEMKNRSK